MDDPKKDQQNVNQEEKVTLDVITLYDEDSNEVQAVPADKLEALKTELVRVKELEKELEGYRDKDYNFEALRKKSEEEREEVRKKMSSKERMLYDKIESLEKNINDKETARIDEYKNGLLDSLSGGDKELRTNIENQEKEFIGEAKTPEELKLRFEKAFTLVQGIRPQGNAINLAYSPDNGYREPEGKKKYTETPEGQKNYGTWFPTKK